MLKLSDALTRWTPANDASCDPKTLLEAAWPDIVGPDVAKNSAPARLANGTLWITTRSSAWSHQLSLLSEHVLRAVNARLTGAELTQLRFKVGAVMRRRASPIAPRRAQAVRRPADRPAAATAAEALAHFRHDVERGDRARRSEGWRDCGLCGALHPPDSGDLCVACETAASLRRGEAVARLLFEAPWLGYAGTAGLVNGLKEGEYEKIRAQLLTRWWGVLMQARAEKRLSRDGRERLIASSYVLLRSQIPPEEIIPATVRNVLGDELHDLIYGTEERTK